MVTKRIRTEYMKTFKDPKWESYSRCYEELLEYRLTRRLLEHTHNPWFWNGSDSDSDVGEAPAQSNKKQAETVIAKDGQEAGEYEECGGDGRVRRGKHRVTLPGSTDTVPKIPLPEEAEDVSPSTSPAANGGQDEGVGELTLQAAEEEQQQKANSRCGKQPTPPARQPDTERKSRHLERVKASSKSKKTPQHVKRVRSAPKHKPQEDNTEGRHPFALYGQGERSADMAAKRTHNVGPAASTVEIHESALRAKTRREVERLLQTQRAEQRRAKSVEPDKNRTRSAQPEFNPWLTEYMRCFSARAR